MPEFDCLSKVAVSDVILLLCWCQHRSYKECRFANTKIQIPFFLYWACHNTCLTGNPNWHYQTIRSLEVECCGQLELVFVKHYAPNCLTLTLLDSQHCLLMTVTTVQIYEISMLFYQKGNNSKPEIVKGLNCNISFNWFRIKSGDLLLNPNKYTKYQGSGLSTFWDILLTRSKCLELQRAIAVSFSWNSLKPNQVISTSSPISV